MRKISCACSAVGMQKDQPVSEEGQLPDQPARWRACSSAPALLSAATSAPSPGDAGGPAGAGSPLRARGEGTGSLREHPAITEPRHSCLHAFSPWDMPLLCAYPQPWDAVALLLYPPLSLFTSASPSLPVPSTTSAACAMRLHLPPWQPTLTCVEATSQGWPWFVVFPQVA